MKSNYEERKANRLEAFQNLAAKNESLSGSLFDSSSKMLSVIPMGQPILVGHHSEKAHRSLLNKADNAMRKGVEAGNKAEYYKGRAESLLNGTAISSDDPNAIDKLTEKLDRLEALQELYKAINKVIRKAIPEAEKVILLTELGLKEATALKMMEPGQFGGMGIPHFRLTNNNATISSTRKRIAHLTKIAAIVSSEKEINGVRLVISSEDNRVQIFFPSIPAEATRTQLKRGGFHWSPTVGAWMRQISNYAIYQAETILTGLTPIQ